MLAKSYLANEFDCVVLDVLSDETASLYKQQLREFHPRRVLLLPSFEEIVRRNGTRPPRLTDEHLHMVYQGQTQLKVMTIESITRSFLLMKPPLPC
jgi:hypothetical protein